METKELAKQLGISHQMANRLKKRGMPTDSLEAAKEWRHQNIDVTQTTQWRIDGNQGIKHELTQTHGTDDYEHHVFKFVLTDVVPKIWFEQIGALAGILRDHGVRISAETLFKVQGCLYLVYMDKVIEFLEEDEEKLVFHIGDILNTTPEDQYYPLLMARLNQILEAEAAR